MWEFLFFLCYHCVQDDDIADIQHMFELLEYIMPCSHCRRSYSLYRRGLPPLSLPTTNHGEECARWLWTVHDMVNQKLGKICISYEKLKRKHACYSEVITDFAIVDILCMLRLASSGSKKRCEKFWDAFKITRRMLQAPRVPSHFRLPALLKQVPVDGEPLPDMQAIMFDVKNKLLEQSRRPTQSMAEFTRQYEHARV